ADSRLYLMRIDYKETPAGLEVFYSEPLDAIIHKAAALALPDGDYLMAGGFAESTYDTLGDVLLFHTQPQQKHIAGWWWLLAAGAVGCIGLFAGLRRRKKADEESAPEKTYPDLQERIVKLMEQEQLFRKPDLRIADIATRLHTNTTYISACINSQMGLSFPRFVTQYRIRFAQQQMKLFPDKKLSSIIDEAGFASENSFFRSFKAETGCTPAEWKQQQAK
ncbi:MAG: helix-turn-helix transcriptional regulator, partial [Bacteroidales bacterium]|nr:helix-turn-helix transcriptional regulator [Bacteroidales bacterium]